MLVNNMAKDWSESNRHRNKCIFEASKFTSSIGSLSGVAIRCW